MTTPQPSGLKKYFNNVKRDMFPNITDWSDPQDHIRNQYDIKGLSTREWFWMHPTAYTLVYYSIPWSVIITFTIGVGVCLWKGWQPYFWLCLCIVLLGFYDLFKRKSKYIKGLNFTFYDYYLREYKFEEVK